MLGQLVIMIKSAGEMGSGIAWRLYRSGFKKIVLVDTDNPVAVRRTVSFSEAIYEGRKTVDGVEGVLARSAEKALSIMETGKVAVLVDPKWTSLQTIQPDVVVDAILAKKNLGTSIEEAPLVIGLGPGFVVGIDSHVVIETNRGFDCGWVLYKGEAVPNTGVPSAVLGWDVERVVRATATGIFEANIELEDMVQEGDVVAHVDGVPVVAKISGTMRGFIRNKIHVRKGMKVGDIEPRKGVNNNLVSDKSLGLGGSVLEALLHEFNN